MRNDGNGGNEQGLGGGCDCDCIHTGDVVEHIMNTDVFGVVIGFAGSLVALRVSPSLATLCFHEWELRHVDDDEVPPSGDEDEVDPASNVVDFTKAVDLRRAKMKGAA